MCLCSLSYLQTVINNSRLVFKHVTTKNILLLVKRLVKKHKITSIPIISYLKHLSKLLPQKKKKKKKKNAIKKVFAPNKHFKKKKDKPHECYNTVLKLSQICLGLVFRVYKHKEFPVSC